MIPRTRQCPFSASFVSGSVWNIAGSSVMDHKKVLGDRSAAIM